MGLWALLSNPNPILAVPLEHSKPGGKHPIDEQAGHPSKYRVCRKCEKSMGDASSLKHQKSHPWDTRS